MAQFKVCIVVVGLALFVLGCSLAETTKQTSKRSLYGSDWGRTSYGHGAVATRVSQSDHVVSVSVPQPYAVPVTRHVPVSVPQLVPVSVPRAVPVSVPHPVPVTVERPYPVEVPRAVSVSVPHPVPYTVNRAVPYDVPSPYPVEVHQHVPVSVPTPVFAPAPAIAVYGYAATAPVYGSYTTDIGVSSLSYGSGHLDYFKK